MNRLSLLNEFGILTQEAQILNGRFQELGYELILQPIKGARKATAGRIVAKSRSRSTSRSTGTGPRKYWKTIAKIVKENNMTRAEARKFYADQKKKQNGAPKGSPEKKSGRKRGFGGKMRSQMRSYWTQIEKIKKDRHVDTAEARKIYSEQKA